MNEALQTIKAGDSVAIYRGFNQVPSIEKVDKITPTGIFVIGHSRFNPDGRMRGSAERWGKTRMRPLTQEICDKIERGDLVYFLRDIKWATYDTATLKAVAALVKAATPTMEPQCP